MNVSDIDWTMTENVALLYDHGIITRDEARQLLAIEDDRHELVEAARSLYAGLRCATDPMDVDERIERLGDALASSPYQRKGAA